MKINTQNSLQIILISLLIGVSLMYVFRPSGMSLLKIGIEFFILFPLILLFYFFSINLKYFKTIPIYFSITFFLLIFWILFTISRSINTNLSDLITLISHYRIGAIVWLTPLAIIYGLNPNNWKTLLNLIPKILIIGIILFFISIPINDFNFFSVVKYWLLFFVFASLVYFYYSKKNKLIIFFSAFAYLYVSINLSQRANLVFFLLILCFILIQYFKNMNVSKYKKIFLALFLITSILFLSFKISDYINKISNDKENNADTRTFLFKELLKDLNETEFIIGKGALGSYHSTYFYMLTRSNKITKTSDTGGDSATRTTSEVGYLFMLLKGGLIMIILHLLILLPAIYLGFFKSKNSFVKGLSLYILSYIIMWIVSYPPELLPEFLLLWIAVGGCISKETRNKTDQEIFQIINQREAYAN